MYRYGQWSYNPDEGQDGIRFQGKIVYGLFSLKRNLICALIKNGGRLSLEEAAKAVYGEDTPERQDGVLNTVSYLRTHFSKTYTHLEQYLTYDRSRKEVVLLEVADPNLKKRQELYGAWNMNAYRHRNSKKASKFKVRFRRPNNDRCKKIGPWKVDPLTRHVYFKDFPIDGLSIKPHNFLVKLLLAYPERVGLAELLKDQADFGLPVNKGNAYAIYTDLLDELSKFPEDLSLYINSSTGKGFRINEAVGHEAKALSKKRRKNKGRWAVDDADKSVYFKDKQIVSGGGFRYIIVKLLIENDDPLQLGEFAEALYGKDTGTNRQKASAVIKEFNHFLRKNHSFEVQPIIMPRSFVSDEHGYILNIPESDMNEEHKQIVDIEHYGRLSIHHRHRRVFIIGDGAKPILYPVDLRLASWELLMSLKKNGRLSRQDIHDKQMASSPKEAGRKIISLRNLMNKAFSGSGNEILFEDKAGFGVAKRYFIGRRTSAPQEMRALKRA